MLFSLDLTQYSKNNLDTHPVKYTDVTDGIEQGNYLLSFYWQIDGISWSCRCDSVNAGISWSSVDLLYLGLLAPLVGDVPRFLTLKTSSPFFSQHNLTTYALLFCN